MDIYTLKYLKLITFVFIIIGAIHLGIIGFFNMNIFKLLGKYSFINVEKILYIIIGICAIINVFSRDYYLPFLGSTVYPCGSLIEKTPKNADIQISVHTPPHSSVIYWASESNKEVVANPWLAYGENTNAGVSKSDGKGLTLLKVRKPSEYKTPMGKKLIPHVHYRVCEGNGMLSRVETVFIDEETTTSVG
jgi:uncharacterized membrane protein YuzA (DUF378 family)